MIHNYPSEAHIILDCHYFLHLMSTLTLHHTCWMLKWLYFGTMKILQQRFEVACADILNKNEIKPILYWTLMNTYTMHAVCALRAYFQQAFNTLMPDWLCFACFSIVLGVGVAVLKMYYELQGVQLLYFIRRLLMSMRLCHVNIKIVPGGVPR